MPRSLPSPMISAVTSNNWSPCLLADLTLTSGVVYVWTGAGTVSWNGNTYTGVGSFASIGDIAEGSEVKALGTAIGLSGIDATLLSDTENDIQIAAPATLWLGLFAAGSISSAYLIFGGTIDRPQFNPGPEKFDIALALENKMANLQRPNNRRYTAADQRNYFPTDSGYNWVETQNDIALLWG